MTPWTVAQQAPLSMEFSGQIAILEWVPCSSPGDLSDPGIEPGSPTLQVGSLPSEPPVIILTLASSYFPSSNNVGYVCTESLIQVVE